MPFPLPVPDIPIFLYDPGRAGVSTGGGDATVVGNDDDDGAKSLEGDEEEAGPMYRALRSPFTRPFGPAASSRRTMCAVLVDDDDLAAGEWRWRR